MRRLLATTSTLALLGAGALVIATPAAATARHVGVVVRYATGRVSTGCASPGGTGLQVLEQHHSVVLGAQQYSGFVLEIDGTGTSRPDNTHYWSYWHSGGGGTWAYSSSGAGSSHPRAGTVEGWSYVNGQSRAPRPPRYTYAALCGHLDPGGKPAKQAALRTTSAAPTPTANSSSVHTEPAAVSKSDTGFPAWGAVVAVVVVAGLGVTAWSLSRRRAN